MDFEQIDNLLKRQIKDKIDFKTGCNEINQLLNENGLPTIDIDIEKTKNHFTNWLLKTIDKNPIPQNIISLYFGLTTLSDKEIEKTAIYLAGSTISPEEDEDWACETEYAPQNNYLFLSEFAKIDELKKENKEIDGEYEVLAFVGMTNLLIQNVLKDNANLLLTTQQKVFGLFKKTTQREKLYVGAGFDSGDIYLLDTITGK